MRFIIYFFFFGVNLLYCGNEYIIDDFLWIVFSCVVLVIFMIMVVYIILLYIFVVYIVELLG